MFSQSEEGIYFHRKEKMNVKEKIVIFLIVWFTIGYFFLMGLIIGYVLKDISINQILCEDYELCKKDIFIEIQKIAYNNSKNGEYEFGVYDCTEFSKDLIKKLDLAGISAYCVWGNLDGNLTLNHTWVEIDINGEIIPIEAVHGKVIPQKEYEKRYKIFAKGVCV